ncbi:glycosyltransferase involved in cell wall biosynthesis [Leucobacter exalbidus]|uniref:D-inositol 3-phosphate glycosyltransferase n=1 Tax=Leucobacter exalbidus TaxID=662960 RepID=A0A940PSY4_9MICO|nr:glycosyltransferase [Leucobacter exalbidus]MBP1326914.1 glycosyltransferase involved in cell wall biosynthesis [Leucobacter exalbidus]
MHVLIVTDQHPDSLGGVQVAIRLQRKYLERLGHRVTIVAPALHRAGYEPLAADRDAYIDLPSRPITADREYGISWPGARTDRALSRALAALPRVDVVHVQGDFWGALIGLRAARGLRVPVVHTMHNHVEEGTRAVTPFRWVAQVAFTGLRAWRGLVLGRARGAVDPASRGAWRYLAELAAEAAVVTAPSRHFAELLEARGVSAHVLVTPGGVDDEAITAQLAAPRTPRSRPALVWLGRMSQEKRVLEFIDAIAESGIDADVTLHGAGLLLPKVRERIAELKLSDRVHLAGPVPYADALAAMRNADALVQTSIGFETQGLTPFEAAVLGTPTIFSDPEVAADVAVDPVWVAAGPTVADLAAALRAAVAELAASGLGAAGLGAAELGAEPATAAVRSGSRDVRVAADAGAAFLQSQRMQALVDAYERALAH